MSTVGDHVRRHVKHHDELHERGPAVLIEAIDDQEHLLRQRGNAPLTTETMQIDRETFLAETLAISEERLGNLQDMVADASLVLPLEKTDNNTSPNICLGRAPTNDVIIGHESVSGRHASIRFDGERYTLRDLGSSNGTFVNQKRLIMEYARTLHDGDCIRLGARVFYFLEHDTYVLFIELRANRVELASS